MFYSFKMFYSDRATNITEFIRPIDNIQWLLFSLHNDVNSWMMMLLRIYIYIKQKRFSKGCKVIQKILGGKAINWLIKTIFPGNMLCLKHFNKRKCGKKIRSENIDSFSWLKFSSRRSFPSLMVYYFSQCIRVKTQKLILFYFI